MKNQNLEAELNRRMKKLMDWYYKESLNTRVKLGLARMKRSKNEQSK